MELITDLGLGFATALSPYNILYCFIGVLLGTAVGVLPGLGPIATIAMLLPITFGLPPVSALIMLAGIYYGAQYGGSTTAILINLPGESSSVVGTHRAQGLVPHHVVIEKPVEPVFLGAEPQMYLLAHAFG